MATKIYIIKRKLKSKRRNGQPHYSYCLRWRDPTTRRLMSEAAGTSDLTQARSIQERIYQEVNRLVPPAPVVAPEPIKPTWQDCRDALKRAMEADNLRPSYVSDALLMFDSLKAAFPKAVSPADITAADANEYKRRRAEQGLSAWTIKGDLSTLKAIFGKWLGQECGLLTSNPFAELRPPKCDEPNVRIVSAEETAELFAWLGERWNNWRLPMVYLEVLSLVGWRATETASLRDDGLLSDGFVKVQAESSKTRRHKHSQLPTDLFASVKACSAGGWAFGRFSDELRRLMLLWRKQPHHAARIKDFAPERFVGWMEDELQRFNQHKAQAAAQADPPTVWETFTLHDFRKTAITGMQMAGVSEKEASIQTGVRPETMRRHYEKLDQLAIAERILARRLGAGGRQTIQLAENQNCSHPVRTVG